MAIQRSSLWSGLKIGFLSGLIGISCCVTPLVLVLFGLSSISFAISLGNTLYYGYGWYFRAAALVIAIAGISLHLKRQKACTLRGARGHWRMIATVLVSMVLVYVALYALTTWLGRAYS